MIFFALTFFLFSPSSVPLCLSLSLSIHFLLNRVPTAHNSLPWLAGSFITVFVWNVSSSIQNWCLRFFAFRAKLIHAFLCLLRLLSSLLSLVASLSFFLCFSRGPFSFLLSFSLFLFFLLLLLLLDHCVARARICVAGDRWPFVPTSKKGEKCTHSNAHTRNHRTQCNIGNIAEGDHSSG